MRIAVIDMGTNTFNLLIAEVYEDNKYHIIFKEKVGVKLGRNGINNRIITPDAFKRGIDAVERHLGSSKKYMAEKIFATATSGIRSTENGKEFVEKVEKKFGIKIDVITGDEEARLVYFGVKQAVDIPEENTLILDIGGGSNEFIIANKSGILWKQSFQLGIARLLDLFNPSDPILDKEREKVEKFIDLNLGDLYEAVKTYKPKDLIGCSGTFDSFRGMILANNGGPNIREMEEKSSYNIHLKDYKKLHKILLDSSLEERMAMKGLEPVRVEMIVLASIFVNFIIEKLKIKSLTHSAFAIKEGMVYKVLNAKI